MHLQEAPDPAPDGGGLPLLAAADLQDDLMVAGHDLDRLQRLLSGACDALLGHFHGATGELRQLLHGAAAQPGVDARQLQVALDHLARAITAMQFQDMASQLVDHTTRRLRHCADRLAHDAFAGDEDDGEGDALVARAPLRPNPVTQDEMDAGSVELF